MNYNKKKPIDSLTDFDKNVEAMITMTITDSSTGNKTVKNFKKRYSKKGFCRMYPKDCGKAIRSISHNRTAVDLWFYWISTGFFKKDGSIKTATQKDLAAELSCTRQSVSSAIKLLEKEELIAKINGEWRYNPFIQNVSSQSDLEITEIQIEWESEIGHYVFKP